MKDIFLTLVGALILGSILAWPMNAYRLTLCDFEAPYKCEVIHTIGVVVPPAAVVTVWFGE